MPFAVNKPTLIWDFDGVMANSNAFVFAYWQQAFKDAGINFKYEDYQATFTYRFPFDYLREKFGETLVKKIYADYSAHEEQLYPEAVSAYPQFVESFKSIAPAYQHFIVSSNLESVINPWLKNYDLSSHFTATIGREQPGYKDEKINLLAAKYQLDKKHMLFIGDTISDMQHAQASEIKAIGVTWGVHSHQQLREVTQGAIYDTIESLFSVLNNAS